MFYNMTATIEKTAPPESLSPEPDKSQPCEEKASFLREHKADATARRNDLRRKELTWSWLRLGLFAGAIAVWAFEGLPTVAATAVTAVCLLLFMHVISRHRTAVTNRELAEHLLQVIDESSRRLGGTVTCIRSHERPDDPIQAVAHSQPNATSETTWPLTHQELEDLDLYTPPVGLFGLLNRTSSNPGARRLRDMCENPLIEASEIQERQQCIRWLAENPKHRLSIMAGAIPLRTQEQRLDQLAGAFQSSADLHAVRCAGFLRIWGILSGLASLVALSLAGIGQYIWLYAILALLSVNGFVAFRMRSQLGVIIKQWSALAIAAQRYLVFAEQAQTSLPRETLLSQLREDLSAVVKPDALPALTRRLAWTDSGGIIHEVLNLLVFWDLHVVDSLLACVVPHRESLSRGMRALAEIESLASLSSFAWEQPVSAYPIVAPELSLNIVDGTHPLTEPKTIVANSFDLNAKCRMWVITGSNMSGKSTFLRMIGTNVLLAQIGTTATAKSMTWQPVRLMSDLRVSDSLADEESYFLAEVRHIRRMVVPPNGPAPCLGLIDEPFRGTNSEEQVAASVAVVEHLLESPHLFIIATHERMLTKLAEDSTARNAHFQENLFGENMVFDYKLRTGPATTRNALRVLEQEGYPESLVRKAKQWIADDRCNNGN